MSVIRYPQPMPEFQNAQLKADVAAIEGIYEDFKEQVSAYGLPFSDVDEARAFDAAVSELRAKGVSVANDRKSFHWGFVSPSCIQCRQGLETVTLALSTQCPRNCFFCFNPNQKNYEALLHATADVCAMLESDHRAGRALTDIALTGGEPLLHIPETLAFFERANQLYPASYTRLYTSGAFLTEEVLQQLMDLNLNEIRFSVKMDDPAGAKAKLLDLMESSKRYIPHVMVEMPVMPDETEEMKALLRELDARGVTGINLLELCFPLHNAKEFAKRGYAIKRTPFRVLYDYWYAGGLPIAGSELACLEVLGWAVDEGLSLGVHYCSLENKLTGQVFQANREQTWKFAPAAMSQRDYFLKHAFAYHPESQALMKTFAKKNLRGYSLNEQTGLLAFPVSWIPKLAKRHPDMQLGISCNILVERSEGPALRELAVDVTTPAMFDPKTDA